MAKFETKANAAMWSLNLVMELISESVVPLTMFSSIVILLSLEIFHNKTSSQTKNKITYLLKFMFMKSLIRFPH